VIKGSRVVRGGLLLVVEVFAAATVLLMHTLIFEMLNTVSSMLFNELLLFRA